WGSWRGWWPGGRIALGTMLSESAAGRKTTPRSSKAPEFFQSPQQIVLAAADHFRSRLRLVQHLRSQRTRRHLSPRHEVLISPKTRKGRNFRGIHPPHFLNGVQARLLSLFILSSRPGKRRLPLLPWFFPGIAGATSSRSRTRPRRSGLRG